MVTTTYFKYIFVTGIFATALSYAFAQGVVTEASSQPVQPTVLTTVVADINLTDVVSKETGSNISGAFAFQGKMGKQNDIVYGIVVIDSKGQVLDGTNLGVQASVEEGEIVRKSFNYTIPTYLSGKGITFMLHAETRGGLPLGSSVLLKKDFPMKESTLSCTSKDTTITCISKIDTTLSIGYLKKKILGEVVSIETKEVKKGEKLVYSKELPPGAYYVSIKNTDMSAQALLALSIKGSYGFISNTVVTEKSPGLLSVVATANISPNIGAKVRAVLMQGITKCGEGEGELKGSVVSFDVMSSCKDGLVTITLVNKDDAILDTKNTPFSVIPYIPPVVPEPQAKFIMTMTTNHIYAGASLILLGILWFIMRAYKKSITSAQQ